MFGGLVYLNSPDAMAYIKASISGVIQAPFYDLQDTESVANWKTR